VCTFICSLAHLLVVCGLLEQLLNGVGECGVCQGVRLRVNPSLLFTGCLERKFDVLLINGWVGGGLVIPINSFTANSTRNTSSSLVKAFEARS
jgi:hypothetical protein